MYVQGAPSMRGKHVDPGSVTMQFSRELSSLYTRESITIPNLAEDASLI